MDEFTTFTYEDFDSFCEDENERPAIDALPMVSAASFAGQKPPAMSDAVFGLIPSRIVVTLNGDGAVGKSLLALQLCIASVSGTPWLGLQVQQGPCLFITAEDEIDECHRRINAICTADGIDIERLGNLNIVSLVGKDALLAVPDRQRVLQTTDMFARLEKTIEIVRPAIVGLDTLADVFGGDEISRPQARKFITLLRGLCRRYDTTIMLLAHPSLAGMASGTGSSGSTGWNNSVRHRQYLTRVLSTDGRESIEQDPDLRVLKTVKNNYGRHGSEMRIRWDELDLCALTPMSNRRHRLILLQNKRAPSAFSLISWMHIQM